ncbi:MAG TPA: hypothetical protein DCE42_20540 [Myxococcales bacterium]|nr:hypothetical protein [Deltaproteobacteria bacterium]MBU47360.1 hypothetical protein [Deltaproteobacteria bacterium]HAA57166.1 hypothetical protein [Myxococcales bacterium]|tara:strand:+ start:7633 stop:9522 length:1890 start_codon:yes stop_codon:yes gene_type:complete
MLNEVKLTAPWLSRLSSDPQTFSEEEWNTLYQEALDTLDYIEKKLIHWETNPKETKFIRRIHSALTRIYEIGWLLRLRPGLDLLQKMSALLEYSRKDYLALTPSDISRFFSCVELLENLFTLRKEQKEATTLQLPQWIEQHLHNYLEWLHTHLKHIEVNQQTPLPNNNQHLGELLIANGSISRSELELAVAQHTQFATNQTTLDQYLVETGAVSPQKIQQTLDLQERIKPKEVAAVSIDSKDLIELKSISGDLKATLTQLQKAYDQLDAHSPLQTHLKQHLDALSEALDTKINSFSGRPAPWLFGRINRMTEEFSRRFDKQVELKLDTNIEYIEKKHADVLNDIVVQLLKNAIEHGIESAQERNDSQKPIPSTLHVHVHHEESNLVFLIEDDGRGFAKQQLLQEAQRCGLMQSDETLDDERITALLFEEGFAIKRSETHPGYGLDKIGRRVRELRGAIQYQTPHHGGARFILTLPLPPSYIHGMIVQRQEQLYLLPTSILQDILIANEADVHYLPNGESRLLWNGHQSIPTKTLRCQKSYSNDTFLSLTHNTPTETEGFYIIVKGEGPPIALFVEQIHEVSMLEIEFIGSSYMRDPLIAGGGFTKDKDGHEQPVWLLDTARLHAPHTQA